MKYKVPLLAASLLLSFTGAVSAQAAGPVNPSTATWVAPTTNADSPPTTLTDLAGYNLRVAPALASGACQAYTPALYTVRKTVTSATPSPAPNLTVKVGVDGSKNLAGEFTPPLTQDGNYCITVTSFDTLALEGAAHTPLPFQLNKAAPSPVTNLLVNP